jgi:hypothetical protein
MFPPLARATSESTGLIVLASAASPRANASAICFSVARQTVGTGKTGNSRSVFLNLNDSLASPLRYIDNRYTLRPHAKSGDPTTSPFV